MIDSFIIVYLALLSILAIVILHDWLSKSQATEEKGEGDELARVIAAVETHRREKAKRTPQPEDQEAPQTLEKIPKSVRRFISALAASEGETTLEQSGQPTLEQKVVRTEPKVTGRHQASQRALEKGTAPTKEQLASLKTVLGLTGGSIQFKKGAIYLVSYSSGKHIWKRLGPWLEMKKKINA